MLQWLCRPGLTLQVRDAVDAVRAARAQGLRYDLVLVDAFDGQDNIPAAFTTAGMPGCLSPLQAHVSVKLLTSVAVVGTNPCLVCETRLRVGMQGTCQGIMRCPHRSDPLHSSPDTLPKQPGCTSSAQYLTYGLHALQAPSSWRASLMCCILGMGPWS